MMKELVSFKNQATDNLTAHGREEVLNKAENELKNSNIDIIVSSPFTRTRETAEIVADTIGIPREEIIFDERLQEVNPGVFDGKSWNEYHQYVHSNTGKNWFTEKISGGESLQDVQKRTGESLYELEEKYKGKNILIVTHGGPAWLCFVNSGLHTPENKEYKIANTHAFVADFKRFDNAEVRALPFVPVPHNENYELDFHRPYIDQVRLASDDGEDMTRVKEVMDVWFDSGAMPFAQDHYPFDNKEWVEGKGFPADYISEAIDQTRGWFYTLHAVGVLMGRGKAYKNVICLGHILDEKGKKMSKSLGNIVDPWLMIEKYGVDTLRMWMYSINQPGESKNFDEKTVALLHQQVFKLLYNVLAFYELYRDKEVESIKEQVVSANILDQWIIARFSELAELVTKNMDSYKLLEPTRGIREFIDDLSTWYLRRSRDRIKEGDKEAKQTLYFILKNLAKIMAPLAPFSAEDIWLRLKNENDVMSVHLSEWPNINKVDEKIISDMDKARAIVTLGLEARQKAGIKVRQPLGAIKLKTYDLEKSYTEIIRDELNIKVVMTDPKIDVELTLDTNITAELQTEGQYRELVRAVQDMRKKEGLSPSDVIVLEIATNTDGQEVISKWKNELLKTVGASEVKIAENEGIEVKIDELVFTINIKK